jgi:DNA-binding MarR family transcriptional regulator
MKINNKIYVKEYLILIFLPIQIFSCGIEIEKRTLANYKTNQGIKINIYYVDPGATGKEVIQVTSISIGKVENVIANFEKNYLKNSALANDSLLILVLTDSGNAKLDTVKLKLLHNYP